MRVSLRRGFVSTNLPSTGLASTSSARAGSCCLRNESPFDGAQGAVGPATVFHANRWLSSVETIFAAREFVSTSHPSTWLASTSSARAGSCCLRNESPFDGAQGAVVTVPVVELRRNHLCSEGFCFNESPFDGAQGAVVTVPVVELRRNHLCSEGIC